MDTTNRINLFTDLLYDFILKNPVVLQKVRDTLEEVLAAEYNLGQFYDLNDILDEYSDDLLFIFAFQECVPDEQPMPWGQALLQEIMETIDYDALARKLYGYIKMPINVE